MDEIEFISYTHTPEERYFMGIATVRLYGKIVLRYKAIMKKDGTGYFIAPATYRIADKMGEVEYLDAVSVDSRLENETIMDVIRSNVTKYMQQSNGNNSNQNQQHTEQEKQQPQQQQQMNLGECPF